MDACEIEILDVLECRPQVAVERELCSDRESPRKRRSKIGKETHHGSMGFIDLAINRLGVRHGGLEDDVQDLPLIIMEYGSERVVRLAEVAIENPNDLVEISPIERVDH